jgi:LmbE family N-acetylglucosaminyl deacetylase
MFDCPGAGEASAQSANLPAVGLIAYNGLMHGITILSPHRDDAAFSLGLSMSRWSQRGIPIRVLNVFTQSAYAPLAAIKEEGLERRGSVSLMRAREDRAALLSINCTIEVQSFNFVDAPLRLGIESNAVCTESARLCRDDNTLENLIAMISRCTRNNVVLTPLALGDHVDHLAVQSAAIAVSRGSRMLGFYEDLPYAIWTSEQVLHERIRDVELRAGVPLRPVVIRETRGIWKKRHIVSGYRSQISGRDADDIARFAGRYGGGERIWIPTHSGRWQSTLQISPPSKALRQRAILGRSTFAMA